jgi:hypothetical protein
MIRIGYIPYYVTRESLETKRYNQYMGELLRDHGKMGVVLLKCA